MKEKLIAYYRVSSTRQGQSGLGLEAQIAAVQSFLKGRNAELVAEFREVESGTRNDRPQLQKAIAACHRTGARLVIARLDRLARNAAFLFNLRDAGLDFVCCDLPEADRFTVGIMAVVAERERELISARTKAALQAAKRRGTKLGNPNLAKVQQRGADATKQAALEFARKISPIIEQIQKKGRVTSQGGIAEALNARGYKTPHGKHFTRHAVGRVLRTITR